MPTQSPEPIPLPPSEQPVIDPATGRMTQAWYDYFRRLDASSRVVRQEIP